MFLKVAQVLLLAVLCSRMAVLLISSPTVSLKRRHLFIINQKLENCCWESRDGGGVHRNLKLFIRKVLNALKSTEMSEIHPSTSITVQIQMQPPLLLSGSINYIKLN